MQNYKPQYEVIRHGIEHAQFFAGCSAEKTPYEHVLTGIGDTERAALTDALDKIAEDHEHGDALADYIEKREAASMRTDVAPDDSEEDEENENRASFYVSVRYNTPEKPPLTPREIKARTIYETRRHFTNSAGELVTVFGEPNSAIYIEVINGKADAHLMNRYGKVIAAKDRPEPEKHAAAVAIAQAWHENPAALAEELANDQDARAAEMLRNLQRYHFTQAHREARTAQSLRECAEVMRNAPRIKTLYNAADATPADRAAAAQHFADMARAAAIQEPENHALQLEAEHREAIATRAAAALVWHHNPIPETRAAFETARAAADAAYSAIQQATPAI